MLLTALFLFLGNPKTVIFIIFVLVLFFGAKRIPELFRGVGQGVREFKDASNPEPQQPHNPNYNQQPGYNQGNQGGYPQQPGYSQQQPQQYAQNGYPQQPQPPTAYNPNGNPQQYGQVPQAPYNPNNTPAS
ncbi:Sec-independent protein translocase subunit TatA/TatB [Hymenobacter cheonanensis]|uniref:Sec-independent protein translocase subunit TatA/TatB n=1 Tax=Hymenobacter sp. CA2-7 TaxID=3063993 RepID=UPI00350F6D53